MTLRPPLVRVDGTGLVTSVGLDATATFAAVRAKVANPTETCFADMQGEPIVAHQVQLEQPWRGLEKLARMAAMAISECLDRIPSDEWCRVPLLLCIADRGRPGRMGDIDVALIAEVQRLLQVSFSPDSSVITHGRAGLGVALLNARRLLSEGRATHVLVAAADSLVNWQALRAYEDDDRLLTSGNSDGFVPGEAGGALLLGLTRETKGLFLKGIGFGMEKARVGSEDPLRGDGLSNAVEGALTEAGVALDKMSFRITDLSGEQYYFKEAALMIGRVLRSRMDEFDLWHPAETIGEVGAVAGLCIVGLADAACRKGFAPGPWVLIHLGSDDGQRTAAVFEYRS